MAITIFFPLHNVYFKLIPLSQNNCELIATHRLGWIEFFHQVLMKKKKKKHDKPASTRL